MAKKRPKQTEENIVAKIKSMVDDSIATTGTWESNQQKWNKMRYRIKKTKNFPFVGCANLRMPTIDTKIRKLKAALMNVIYGIRPVVQVVPTPQGNWESAIKIEKFLDHLIMDVMDIKSKSIIAIDQTLEKGFYLMKPYWRTEIVTRIENMSIDDLSMQEAMFLFDPQVPMEAHKMAIAKRFDVDMNPLVAKENQAEIDKIHSALMSGEKEFKASFQDVIYDFPDVSLCEPERIYVPTDSGFDPQSCRYIIHEFLMPIEQIKQCGLYKGWDIGEIEDIESAELSDYNAKNIDDEKDTREGILQRDETGKITVWEFYGYYDINNDGVEEKCVITMAPDFEKVFRKITNPFYSGKLPFVKLFYELADDRWFSHRGIPELVEDIVKEIDIQHCQKIDQQTIRNTPQFVHRAGMINKNSMQFLFGQSYPVHGMSPLNDIIAPLNNNNPNVEFSYEKEQMILEGKIEELIGQIDYNLQSMINKRQPRTLGEVQLQFQSSQQVFSLDSDMFRTGFEKLFNWIWELWCQYGSDNYEFAYFGKNGYEPIRLTKEETQGKYKITVRGNDQNTNAQMRIQKAQMILMAVQNPMLLQTGVVTPVNLANAMKRFYQELDIPNWEELVMPAPMIMQQMQAQMANPPVADIRIKPKDLTDAEVAQVLAKRGIQPDVQGRALKSEAIVQEKRVDQGLKKTEGYRNIADMVEQLSGGNGAETEEEAGSQQ
jgi:hypothetical protein